MQFKVESAGITHRLPVGVASPQRCCACVTVGTEGTCALADNLRHRKGYSQAFQTTLVTTDYLSDGLQRRQKRPVSACHTSLFLGRIRGLFWPFILWYSPQALHR